MFRAVEYRMKKQNRTRLLLSRHGHLTSRTISVAGAALSSSGRLIVNLKFFYSNFFPVTCHDYVARSTALLRLQVYITMQLPSDRIFVLVISTLLCIHSVCN